MTHLLESLSDFFHSIRFRITLWFILILAIVLASFSVFIYLTQSRDYQLDAVGNMQEKLARLQTYFHSAEWQNSDLSPTVVPTNQAPLQTGDLIIFVDTTGQILQNWGENPVDQSALVGELLPAATNNHATQVYEQTILIANKSNAQVNTDYLFVIVPVVRADMLLGFMILGSPSPLTDHLRRLSLTLLIGSLAMLVIAFVGGLWLADRAMRPVKAIANAAHTIGESDLSRRLNINGRDELAQLAGTFDDMLARLQSAFERQRQFLADASHELRTPLTVMNLEVGRVLTGHRSSTEYQHALQTVNAESTRMTRLVNELMALARMDSGQTPLKMDDLDLSDVVVEAIERMSPLAMQEEVRIDTGELPELIIRGDRQYLIQMISNLIENGIKYSGSGQTVKIETGAIHKHDQEFAVLKVSDTGPGIAADHLPHIFDRFYRVDTARAIKSNEDTDSPTGSGLGLSIVAWIVRVHGGEIHASSKVNEGTIFEVSLTLKK